MAFITIISKDKDFAQPLAEQVKRELKLDCRIGNDAGAALVVTTESGSFDMPVIHVKDQPVRMNVLLADIEAALQSSGEEAIALGSGCLLQLRQKQLIHPPSGKTADVTDKEAQLLQVLGEAGKSSVAKEKLLKDVWGIEAELNTHTLETHVYRLRAKFRELTGEEVIIAINGGYGLKK